VIWSKSAVTRRRFWGSARSRCRGRARRGRRPGRFRRRSPLPSPHRSAVRSRETASRVSRVRAAFSRPSHKHCDPIVPMLLQSSRTKKDRKLQPIEAGLPVNITSMNMPSAWHRARCPISRFRAYWNQPPRPTRGAPRSGFPLRVKDGPILSQARSRSRGPLSDQVADAPNSHGQCRSWVECGH
jgi:hypothetical protein